jgi:hypothetical protein
VAEPTNAYDQNARKILIEGALVGYLPRDQALRFNEQLAAVGRSGADIDVAALVTGGWRTNQHDEGSFGVKLGAPVQGTLSFEGIDRPTLPEVKPEKKPVAAKIEFSDDDLGAVKRLVDRLNSTDPLPAIDAEQRYSKFFKESVRRMVDDGLTYGQSSGAPGHLTKGEEHFRAEMSRMDSQLQEQVRIFESGLNQWFDHGEPFAPYYPHRIAVILRKGKRGDLESAFLIAYVRHFKDMRSRGARYAEILERARKLGIEA